MPVEGAVVARDDLPPARDFDARVAVLRNGSQLSRTLQRSSRSSALVAQHVESLGILETGEVSLLGETSPAVREKVEGDARQRVCLRQKRLLEKHHALGLQRSKPVSVYVRSIRRNSNC